MWICDLNEEESFDNSATSQKYFKFDMRIINWQRSMATKEGNSALVFNHFRQLLFCTSIVIIHPHHQLTHILHLWFFSAGKPQPQHCFLLTTSHHRWRSIRLWVSDILVRNDVFNLHVIKITFSMYRASSQCLLLYDQSSFLTWTASCWLNSWCAH